MSFGGESEEDGFSAINVTPLVDITLVLLIIFMITAPAIYQSAIKVQLPKAKSGENAEKSPVEFSISKSGEVAWGKEPVSFEMIAQRLRSAGTEKLSGQTAMISADEGTPHGTVVRLMDTLRSAGLTRFALSVDGR